jgi:hypothetical protein
VSRAASFVRHFRLSLGALLAFASLTACTQQSTDDGPTELFRTVPASNQNLALSFDGLDDYATTGTAQFPSGRSTQTISAWFELETVAGKHALITLRKDFDSGVELALQDGVLGAFRVFGNRTLVSSPTAVTAGTWHHAAYTFDVTNNQLWLDGVMVASSANAPDERTPTTCWLGTLDGTRDLFKGLIDDFRVFNVVRTAGQIGMEATGTFSSSDAGLVLDLPCNENAGDLVYDHSPLANDGQLGDGIDQRMPARVMSGSPNDLN